MLRSVEGVCRDGKVELQETPPDIREARVIVTFLPAPGPIDLRRRNSNGPGKVLMTPQAVGHQRPSLPPLRRQLDRQAPPLVAVTPARGVPVC